MSWSVGLDIRYLVRGIRVQAWIGALRDRDLAVVLLLGLVGGAGLQGVHVYHWHGLVQ